MRAVPAGRMLMASSNPCRARRTACRSIQVKVIARVLAAPQKRADRRAPHRRDGRDRGRGDANGQLVPRRGGRQRRVGPRRSDPQPPTTSRRSRAAGSPPADRARPAPVRRRLDERNERDSPQHHSASSPRAAIPLAALAVAGCGGGGDAPASPASPETSSGRPATVGAATTGLGQVLVDSNGRTVYLFRKDDGMKSACSGACADAWPPVRAHGKPTVGAGADASQVGTTARTDGKPQVTYNGHPLYLYRGDEKPGDTTGQGSTGFGAAWYALSPAGNEITARPSAASSRRRQWLLAAPSACRGAWPPRRAVRP